MPIPQNYKVPVVLSAKERAFHQIQEWIIDGTLLPGERINDIELAKAIGVSRTPIREALQMLGFQGFVSMKPGVATTVNPIDIKNLNQILLPLAALEALAAEIAASVATREDTQLLQDYNQQFAQAITEKDFFKALKMDEIFHAKIVQMCNNSHISDITTSLQAHVRRYFFHNAIFLTAESVTEHEKIIEALAKHDSATASRIAKQNWTRPTSGQCDHM